jgi:hypothetical protein
LWMRPVLKSTRSVSVVLPASTWAMMPMLRFQIIVGLAIQGRSVPAGMPAPAQSVRARSTSAPRALQGARASGRSAFRIGLLWGKAGRGASGHCVREARRRCMTANRPDVNERQPTPQYRRRASRGGTRRSTSTSGRARWWTHTPFQRWQGCACKEGRRESTLGRDHIGQPADPPPRRS